MKPRIVAAIPARMGSSRFPGKPLIPILGIPMVEHVRRRVERCEMLDGVYVATCDREIADTVARFGGCVVMTSSTHERATDRVAELAQTIDADIYVMVQGDEPMVVPEMITMAVEPLLRDASVVCSNLASRICTERDFLDRDTIKVVMAGNGDALYMSREPVPTASKLRFEGLHAYKQVCVIPFRRDFLRTYMALPPTPLEVAESIDMLRALEHGYPVRLVISPFESHAVDHPDDVPRVERLMKGDSLFLQYASHD
jgi:3-deoxy-manno-octulosonate cytidylyltransferase (CMP-KDO synthetase)